MSEFKFLDVYWHEKREENCLGLECLNKRLSFIETLNDKFDRFNHLFCGLLAGLLMFKTIVSCFKVFNRIDCVQGNVYDYGAQAFIQKNEKGDLNEFDKALGMVEGTCLKLKLSYESQNMQLTNIFIF